MPDSKEVYHCPSCGALATVESETEGVKYCQECGFEFRQVERISPRGAKEAVNPQGAFVQRDVCSQKRMATRVQAVIPTEVLPSPEVVEEGADEVISDDGHKKVVRRRKKRRRPRMAPLLFLSGWASVVIVTAFFINRHAKKREQYVDTAKQQAEKAERIRRQEMSDFVESKFPSCQESLMGYLRSDATGRTQYVRNSNQLAAAMNGYYLKNLPFTVPGGATISIRWKNLRVGHEGRPTAIEAVLGFDGSGNTTYPDREVAFVLQDDRWVVDWEAFVRYSETSWQIFKEAGGPSEGEFRLYMRLGKGLNRVEAERKVVVQFFPPGSNEMIWTYGSERLDVPLDTENGQRIQEIVEWGKKAVRAGDSKFRTLDPDGLHRVRVKLVWEEPEEGQRQLRLVKVLAGNWYGAGFEEPFKPFVEEEKTEQPEERVVSPERVTP